MFTIFEMLNIKKAWGPKPDYCWDNLLITISVNHKVVAERITKVQTPNVPLFEWAQFSALDNFFMPVEVIWVFSLHTFSYDIQNVLSKSDADCCLFPLIWVILPACSWFPMTLAFHLFFFQKLHVWLLICWLLFVYNWAISGVGLGWNADAFLCLHIDSFSTKWKTIVL